jgi:hypothetical protein
MVQLSTLNNNAINLANHVNTVTKTQYITPYPPEDKPSSLGQYYDAFSFSKLFVETDIDENKLNLYLPNNDDTDQTTFKESWEVSQNRVEVLDPNSLFDSISSLCKEINLVKDLTTDLLEGKYNDDDVDTSKLILEIISSIKTHTSLIEKKSDRFNSEYNQNFEKFKENAQDLYINFVVPLTKDINDVTGNSTFYIQSTSVDAYSIKKMNYQEFKAFSEKNVAKLYHFLFDDIQPRSFYEDLTKKHYRFSDQEWKKFRDSNRAIYDELVDSYIELLRASLIYPMNMFDWIILGPSLFAPEIKLTTVELKALIKASSLEAKIVEAQSISKLNKESVKKYTQKIVPNLIRNIPCFGIKSLTKECVSSIIKYIVGVPQNEYLKKIYTKAINEGKFPKIDPEIVFGNLSKKESNLYNALELNRHSHTGNTFRIAVRDYINLRVSKNGKILKIDDLLPWQKEIFDDTTEVIANIFNKPEGIYI